MTDKNMGGRPLLYADPNEMQVLIDLYFFACRINKIAERDKESDKGTLLDEAGLSDKALLIVSDIDCIVPTVSGLAYALNMTTRSFVNYAHKDDFERTIQRAKQRIEMSLEQRLSGNNVTGALFNLKCNFKWVETTAIELNGSLGFNVTIDKTDAETL